MLSGRKWLNEAGVRNNRAFSVNCFNRHLNDIVLEFARVNTKKKAQQNMN